jgi:hypothetical protein
MQTHKDFWVITLDQQGHEKTCNYWYLVQTYGGSPHIAFTRRSSLENWAFERGLMLPDMPSPGTHSCSKMEGAYRTQMHSSYDEFYSIEKALEVRVLSNARWTLGLVTKDSDGIRTVHTLNPNCKHRPVFDYEECRVMFG